MWTCSKCAEQLQDDFDVCWHCGTSKDGVEDPNFLKDEPDDAGADNEPYPELTNADLEEMAELVTVAHFNLLPQAHAAKLELEAAGIPVFLEGENAVAVVPLLANAIGGLKLQVRPQDEERARGVIDALDMRASHHHDEEEDEEEEKPATPGTPAPPPQGVMAEEEFWRRQQRPQG